MDTPQDSDTVVGKDKEWIPYQGPRGGTGWQLADGKDVTYDDEPPGEALTPEDTAELMGISGDKASETLSDARDVIDNADDSVDVEPDTIMQQVVGELVHRLQESKENLRDINDTQFEQYIGGKTQRVVETLEDRADMEVWERELRDAGQDQAAEQAVSRANELAGEVADFTDGEITESDVMERFRDPESVTMDELPDDPETKFEFLMSIEEDNIREEWASQQDLVDDVLEPEIESVLDDDDSIGDDIGTSAVQSALEEQFDVTAGRDAMKQINFFNAEPLDAAKDVIEDKFAAAAHPEIENVKVAREVASNMQSAVYPFRNRGVEDELDDGMNIYNADDITPLGETGVSGGRSQSSMYIAEGVPDDRGDERPLFITNTNPGRGDAEANTEGERCVSGSAGLREAGLATPRYQHIEGEFWVSEDAPGEVIDETDLTLDDIDEPVNSFAEMGAAAAIVGAVDLHDENVAVHEDHGFVPFDLDLTGCQTGKRANARQNPFGFGQDNMMRRMNVSFSSANMGEEIEWDTMQSLIVQESRKMAEDGTARDMLRAATSETDETDIEMAIEENVLDLEARRYWKSDYDGDTTPDGPLGDPDDGGDFDSPETVTQDDSGGSVGDFDELFNSDSDNEKSETALEAVLRQEVSEQ